MRVSPLWLLVSGLSFISFVVLCNWFFVPANLAQADPAVTAARGNAATNRSSADAAAPRPDSRNSRTASSAGVEVADASLKTEQPQPAPATPAPTAAPAPPAPTPEQKVEQPKAAEDSAQQQPAAAGRFTVQVGSYSTPGEAEARAANLKSAGQPVRVAEVDIPKRGKWYRVYVGGFASRAEAETHGKSLRGRGLAESYIATEAQ
jgi:cell division protein FtsN